MTTSSTHPALQGSPLALGGERVPLYTPEFAADPAAAYREMRRRFGPLVPVDLAPDVPATLVVGYRHALRILHDPDHFPADPRRWQETVPPDCPLLPMMEYRPNALRSAGEEHARLRPPIVAGLESVDQHLLRATIERLAIPLINDFCEAGAADLRTQYAFPLTFATLTELMGLSPETGRTAFEGMAAILDATSAESAAAGNTRFAGALMEVVGQKRACPARDVTSRMMQHESRLDDMEMVQQAALVYAAGTEPTTSLITTTLRLMLIDDRFGSHMLGGSLSTRDAIDEVLFTDPPLPNFCTSYPRQPILVGNTWLPADQPVVISIAACNTDPRIGGGERIGNRSHLAWGQGTHACMAEDIARIIAGEAVDQLLDALPEIELAIPTDQLEWRPGLFHRALSALPVRFPPSAPLTPMRP
ncbi:cytochrome P450 [Nocardia jinanensis]|uniref:Cytochrome P450 n=1 Tax=Nocardia jinanensis TaxID=382504 RepID=A0A917RA67_9NOCA|nr:cytochrome P450 [Nocardia jinanensis]GGK96943.1 cytochrome P450 [Nocardia jinanensis]